MSELTTVRPEFLPSGPTPPPSGDGRQEEAPLPSIFLQLQAALLAAAYVKFADPWRILS